MVSEEQPKIGVGLLVIKDGRVLLGKRRTNHAHGEFGGTGGHLEHLESCEAAALRELTEEAGQGLKIKNLRLLAVSNMTRYNPAHFVVISFIADWQAGEPEVTETGECESWGWYDLNNLPNPLYAATSNDIQAYKTGEAYFDDAPRPNHPAKMP